MPDSNPPSEPSTTTRAASACAAPEIMLGTKSRCPGASRSVTRLLAVSKRASATSTVTPLLRSSGRSSSIQAHAKLALPISFACFCALVTSRSVTTPVSYNSRPNVVDFPASTWPSTTSDSTVFFPADRSSSAAWSHSFFSDGSITKPPTRSASIFFEMDGEFIGGGGFGFGFGWGWAFGFAGAATTLLLGGSSPPHASSSPSS